MMFFKYEIMNKKKYELFILLIILNIILRFQVISNEIYPDSFLMHIMTNSLNEYGFAKWYLHPLSLFGVYPVSYSSSMQFFISAVSQCTVIEMRWVIFLYCLLIGVFSIFTSYIMAGEIINNNLFKLLVAFGFSTSPAILGYTTWTIPTRGLFMVLALLFIFVLIKSHTSSTYAKYFTLSFILAILLYATHHLFYFLIPAIFVFFFLSINIKLRNIINIKIPDGLIPFALIAGFFLMFSIPFFTGHFLDQSRYSSFVPGYVRYIGILIIFTIGGLGFLIFKRKKDFKEWFLLLTLMILTIFIYKATYMKWFIPIFAIPLAVIGILNLLRSLESRKIISSIIIIIILLFSVSFSSYYQFINFLPKSETSEINARYLEESTYKTGRWMKEKIINGSVIANDMEFGYRIFASSETTHLLVPSAVIDQIYGYININMSEFKIRKITDEGFFRTPFEGPGYIAESKWAGVHDLRINPQQYNINYIVENRNVKGNLYWHHGIRPSKFLQLAYNENNLIYDSGKINLWCNI